MNRPNPQEIRAKVEQRRQHDREEMRRQEEAMEAFSVEAAHALIGGLEVMNDEPDRAALEPAVDVGEVAEDDARRAIDARRFQPASPVSEPRPAEPPLRAALRSIVADYAAPLSPSDDTIDALEGLRGIALAREDTYALWADLQLQAAVGVRDAMPDVIDVVTARAESVIVAELVAAARRLHEEYPDAPRPCAGGASHEANPHKEIEQ